MSSDSYDVVADLAEDGVAIVPPGKHKFNSVIVISHDMRLTGYGDLVWDGDPNEKYPIRFGKPGNEEANYNAKLSGIRLFNGGIKIQRFAQHCRIEDIWVGSAPEHAFLIEGYGDYQALENCVAWAAKGDGFRVSPIGSNNGLKFLHCNAQQCGGMGLRCEPIMPGAGVYAMMLRDCVFQGNQADSNGGEVLLAGWSNVIIDGSFVETRDNKPGIIVVDQKWPEGRRIPTLIVRDTQVDRGATPAIDIRACVNPTFNNLMTTGMLRYNPQTYNGGVDSSRPIYEGPVPTWTLVNSKTGSQETPRTQ